MDTISQRFAKTAFEQVSSVAETHEKGSTFRQKYGSMAHRLPILIRTSGLAQALAFVQARARKENGQAYSELLDHLAASIQWPGAGSGDNLVTKSRTEHLDSYILLTRRVTTALVWYKRFAESILDITPVDELPDGGTS